MRDGLWRTVFPLGDERPVFPFNPGLVSFFGHIQYLGDGAHFPCFRPSPCLGLFINVQLQLSGSLSPPRAGELSAMTISHYTIIGTTDLLLVISFGSAAFFYGAFHAIPGKTS